MKRYVWIQVTTISWDLCITMEEVHRLDIIHLIYYIMMQHICVTIVTFENYIVCVTILTALIWYSTVAMMHSHNRYIEDGRLSHQYLPWRQHKLGRGLGAETITAYVILLMTSTRVLCMVVHCWVHMEMYLWCLVWFYNIQLLQLSFSVPGLRVLNAD